MTRPLLRTSRRRREKGAPVVVLLAHSYDTSRAIDTPLLSICLPAMMKLVLATALVASASAFTSQADVRSASVLAASPYAEELGAMKPVRRLSVAWEGVSVAAALLPSATPLCATWGYADPCPCFSNPYAIFQYSHAHNSLSHSP
jgi:hypothetical protein